MSLIIEGLLMYFDEAQVKALLLALVARFPGAEALIEVIGVSMAAKSHLNDSVSQTSAHFKWGIRDASEIATWDERIHYLGDVSIYDRHVARWEALNLSLPASFADLRNTVDRVVHLSFA